MVQNPSPATSSKPQVPQFPTRNSYRKAEKTLDTPWSRLLDSGNSAGSAIPEQAVYFNINIETKTDGLWRPKLKPGRTSDFFSIVMSTQAGARSN